jgi:hypothetical protein
MLTPDDGRRQGDTPDPAGPTLQSVDYGPVELAEAQLALKAHVGFVKAYLERGGTAWQLRYVEVVTGAVPPGWLLDRWEYDEHLFVAEEVSGDVLADVLTTAGGELRLGGKTAVVLALTAQTSRGRHASRTRLASSGVLPWPLVEYKLTAAPTSPPQSSLGGHGRMLIGEDCPSFADFWAAFDAFFRSEDVPASRRSHPQPTDLGMVWVAQPQTWLDRVRITATHVQVQLAGDRVEDVRVELNGTALRAKARSGPDGQVMLPLPEGLPEDTWLFATQGRRWLDYRRLGVLAAGQDDAAFAGVEIEVPDDPDTEISALLSTGEGPYLEYKRQLPDNTIDSKRKVLKTVAAFASGHGGTIVFGMDPDEVTVTGIAEGYKAARDRLGQLICGNIVPPDPAYQIRHATANSKFVVILEVQPSASGPYGLQFGDKTIEFYVRRGSSTYAATQQEVRAMAAS